MTKRREFIKKSALGSAGVVIGDYEKFANDPEADALLTRVYRKPYVVPDEV